MAALPLLLASAVLLLAVPAGQAGKGPECDSEPATAVIDEGETYVGDETSEVVVVEFLSAQKRGNGGLGNHIRTKAGSSASVASPRPTRRPSTTWQSTASARSARSRC